jgi:copper oxidase (laccase) domain-containing protein
MSSSPLIETFSALTAIPGLVYGFLLRHPDIPVDCDRREALARLEPVHGELLAGQGVSRNHLATGEQVHAAQVGVVAGLRPARVHFPETDALVTGTLGQFLGIWVADCGAVYIVDPVRRVCGLAHSGKKGSELGIAAATIAKMQETYGSEPASLVVQLAPCIRPPAYEVDFAAQIVADCVAAGVPAAQVHDCGTCTSRDLTRYYSYRVEKGRTGRHFAFIGWPLT